MVALLIYKILRLGIIALRVLHGYLGAVFIEDIAQFYAAGGGDEIVCKGEANGLRAVVDFKLGVKEQFQFLEKLSDSPVRQGTGVLRSVPCRRKAVAHE